MRKSIFGYGQRDSELELRSSVSTHSQMDGNAVAEYSNKLDNIITDANARLQQRWSFSSDDLRDGLIHLVSKNKEGLDAIVGRCLYSEFNFKLSKVKVYFLLHLVVLLQECQMDLAQHRYCSAATLKNIEKLRRVYTVVEMIDLCKYNYGCAESRLMLPPQRIYEPYVGFFSKTAGLHRRACKVVESLKNDISSSCDI